MMLTWFGIRNPDGTVTLSSSPSLDDSAGCRWELTLSPDRLTISPGCCPPPREGALTLSRIDAGKLAGLLEDYARTGLLPAPPGPSSSSSSASDNP